MITRTDDLVDLVAFHAGIPAEPSERALRSVLGTIGAHLRDGNRQRFADELPPDLAVALAEDGPYVPVGEELLASVCRALSEEISHESVRAIRDDVPESIARYFAAGVSSERTRDFVPIGHVLASAKPGHAHSVAAENPHGDRKLSSTRRAR
jgi:uncharacterized protein (DUF2267 family)